MHCDGSVCRTRTHGIGRVGSSKPLADEGAAFPELGQLRKLNTQPPTWFFDIDGQSVEFSTEELLTPKLFMFRVANILSMSPSMPAQATWTKIINEHMASVQHIEAPEDSSTRGFFMDLLERFCTGRAQAKERDEVLQGRPYNDGDTVWFRMQDLVGFLTKHRFTSLDSPKITAVFHTEGFRQEMWDIRGRNFNVWGVPLFPAQKGVKKEERVEESIL